MIILFRLAEHYPLDIILALRDTLTMTQDTLDIRDIEAGEIYYVITSDERGGRCVMNGMFIAAWRDKAEAKAEANSLGAGYHVIKQVKR
jgi:hypothetical protein